MNDVKFLAVMSFLTVLLGTIREVLGLVRDVKKDKGEQPKDE